MMMIDPYADPYAIMEQDQKRMQALAEIAVEGRGLIPPEIARSYGQEVADLGLAHVSKRPRDDMTDLMRLDESTDMRGSNELGQMDDLLEGLEDEKEEIEDDDDYTRDYVAERDEDEKEDGDDDDEEATL